jgi:hypothetical protein
MDTGIYPVMSRGTQGAICRCQSRTQGSIR